MFSKEVAIRSSSYHLGRSVKADRDGASVLWPCSVARPPPRLTCGTPEHVGGWQVGSIRMFWSLNGTCALLVVWPWISYLISLTLDALPYLQNMESGFPRDTCGLSDTTHRTSTWQDSDCQPSSECSGEGRRECYMRMKPTFILTCFKPWKMRDCREINEDEDS